MKPEDRIRIHTDIHQLCYYGGGGFTITEVYDMPVFLRHFHLQQLAKTKEAESAALKQGEDAKPSKKKIISKPF